MKLAHDSAPVAPMPPSSRSAKTNGRRMFVDGDGRGPWARRWRDLQELYADDLGGASTLSELQIGLISTAATLRCEIEKLEGQLSLSEDVDIDRLGRIVGHFRRMCETLGIERRQRVLTPSVDSYLAHVAAEEDAA